MFCQNCGARIDDGVNFCPGCGAQIISNTAPQGQQVRQEWLNDWEMRQGQVGAGQGGASGRNEKGGYTVLWIGLASILIIAGLFWFFIGRTMNEGKVKPYGGAKIKDQVIWETDGLKVSATGLYLEEGSGEMAGGYRMDDGIELTIDNGTGQDLEIGCVSLAVDGASVQCDFNAPAPAGKKSEAVLKMDNYSLYNMQVETVGEITAELTAKDARNGEELYDSGIVSIETTKLKEADTPAYRYDADALFKEDGITVRTMGYTEIPGLVLSYAVVLQVENSTSQSVRLDFYDIELNGRSFDYTGSAVFQAGTKGVCYVEAPFDDLDKIEKSEGDFFPVKEISGTCRISDVKTGGIIKEVEFEYEE